MDNYEDIFTSFTQGQQILGGIPTLNSLNPMNIRETPNNDLNIHRLVRVNGLSTPAGSLATTEDPTNENRNCPPPLASSDVTQAPMSRKRKKKDDSFKVGVLKVVTRPGDPRRQYSIVKFVPGTGDRPRVARVVSVVGGIGGEASKVRIVRFRRAGQPPDRGEEEEEVPKNNVEEGGRAKVRVAEGEENPNIRFEEGKGLKVRVGEKEECPKVSLQEEEEIPRIDAHRVAEEGQVREKEDEEDEEEALAETILRDDPECQQLQNAIEEASLQRDSEEKERLRLLQKISILENVLENMKAREKECAFQML